MYHTNNNSMKTELGKEEQPNNKVVLDPGSKLVIFEKMGKKGLEADQSYAQSVTYGKGFPFGNWYIKMLKRYNQKYGIQ